jgi:hypothetical protein
LVDDALKGQDIPPVLRQVIIAGVGTLVGGATGGTAGAVTGGNATVNNYLSHNPINGRSSQLTAFANQLARCKVTPGCNVDGVYSYWAAVSRQQQGDANAAILGDYGSFGVIAPGLVGAIGLNPLDYCQRGDTRCINFITANNGQAFSLISTANVLDGTGPRGPGTRPTTGGTADGTSTPNATTPRLPGPSGTTSASTAQPGTVRVVADEILDASGTVISRYVNGAWVPVGGQSIGVGGGSATPTPSTAIAVGGNAPNGLRVTNGVTLDLRLPDPVAGLNYQPTVLANVNPNIANSQVNGYVGELNLANTVAALPNQQVISYAGPVGTHGADVVSVNVQTGEVTLWDSKFRTSPVPMPPSTTFTPGSSALNNALVQAEDDIRNSSLPPAVKDKAIQNLNNGNFSANTAGAGAVRNSTPIRFCNRLPC